MKHIPRVTYVEGAVPTITFGLDTSQKWGSAPTITFDLDTTVVIGFRFPGMYGQFLPFWPPLGIRLGRGLCLIL